jgi:NADH:ubiquinone reductase (H+-translocating)
MGQLVSLGRYKGVALVLGIRVRGPAWFLHRTYHVSRIPTLIAVLEAQSRPGTKRPP